MTLEKPSVPSSWPAIASALEAALGLTSPPLAITFGTERPEGIPAFDAPMPPPLPDGRTGRVAAGCVFWMEGVDKTFSTVPEDHGNCSVGSLTHGLVDLPDIVDRDDVGALLGTGWVDEAVVPQIPMITERPGAITYGPLAETPIEPDLVFMRLGAEAMMLLTDTLPEAQLGSKPQCHIIAAAREHGTIAISAGCTLSRTRTGMPESQVTCAFPADRATEIVERLVTMAAIDEQVRTYAEADAARFG